MNVTIKLRNREYCHLRNTNRTDFKILRSLVVQGCRVYKKVWEKKSNKNFLYEDDKIFSDNFRVCYHGYNFPGGPHRVNFHSILTGLRIEDALLVKAHAIEGTVYQSKLYCVGSNGMLYSYLTDSGQPTEQVFLSSRYKFKEIAFLNDFRSFTLKTTINTAHSQFARRAGIQINMVMVLAVFRIHPLEFECMFEVDKRIFGSDVTSSVLSHDLLITMHQSGYVKFYSYKYILEKYKEFDAPLFSKFDDSESKCGLPPHGLPFNVVIKECPPVLFQTKCADHNVQIGGFPWHYVITPHGSMGYFEVRSVDNDKIIKNGELDMDVLGPEQDRAYFYNDDSGRIIHIGSTEIRMLNICTGPEGRYLTKLYQLQMFKSNPQEAVNSRLTSSGRVVKRRISTEEVEDCPNVLIHEVDYEDELDLMYVTTVTQEEEKSQGLVTLYDHLTGTSLRVIHLEEPFKEYYEHKVSLNLETVVQVVKKSPGLFLCQMYRLVGETGQQERTKRRKSHRKVTAPYPVK